MEIKRDTKNDAITEVCECESGKTISVPGPPRRPKPDVLKRGSDHYKLPIEPIEYIMANKLGYCEGNVVKYITRWRVSGGRADLEKAKHYIDLLLEYEVEEERKSTTPP